jgi:hypothetical protein
VTTAHHPRSYLAGTALERPTHSGAESGAARQQEERKVTREPTGCGHADAQGAGWYEIRIQGRLGERWMSWFDEMALRTDDAGVTTLRGQVIDQAALHGLLARVRDIGLPLLAVERIADPTGPGGRDGEETT